jgi:hypothetical protein
LGDIEGLGKGTISTQPLPKKISNPAVRVERTVTTYQRQQVLLLSPAGYNFNATLLGKRLNNLPELLLAELSAFPEADNSYKGSNQSNTFLLGERNDPYKAR